MFTMTTPLMVVVNRGQDDTFIADVEMTGELVRQVAETMYPAHFTRVEVYEPPTLNRPAKLVMEGKRYGDHWIWTDGQGNQFR